jgi:hypothetical protein
VLASNPLGAHKRAACRRALGSPRAKPQSPDSRPLTSPCGGWAQADPDNGYEEEYKFKNDKVFCWKANRLIARRKLSVYTKWGGDKGGDLDAALPILMEGHPEVRERERERATVHARLVLGDVSQPSGNDAAS